MRLRWLALACVVSVTSACSGLGYYAHVARGQVALLARREKISAIVDDPRRDPVLRARLAQALAAREFASERLGLPRNPSYESYVELGRPYVTWNVFATPEFSVEPITHCFPFAGCVAYQGWFDEARAQHEAAALAARGRDVAVEGAVAYSTLGWFADPILSSMLRWNDDQLDGTIFHELAHQKVYVKDDTAFNESWASFVQREGLREWRAVRGLAAPDTLTDARAEAFSRLVLDLRARLEAVYASGLPAAAMRERKQAEFDAFRQRHARLREAEWAGDPRYDRWVAAPLNNARLLPFGLYDRWIDAFARLFGEAEGSWPLFHARVAALAALPRREREAELRRLAPESPANTGTPVH